MNQDTIKQQEDKALSGVRALDGTRHFGGRFYRPSPEQQKRQRKNESARALSKLAKAKAKYGDA